MQGLIIAIASLLLYGKLASGAVLEVARLLGNDQAITSLALSPHDERTLIVSDQKNHVIVWNIATKMRMWSAQLPKRAYASAFSSDGQMVVIGGRYQMLAAYDVRSGQLLTEFEKSPNRHRSVHQVARLSSDNRYLLTVATMGDEIPNSSAHYPEIHESERQRLREKSGQKCMLWSMQSGKLLNEAYCSDDATVIELGLSRDEDQFFTVSRIMVNIRKTKSGDLLKSFPVEEFSSGVKSPVILAAAFDPSLRFLALSLVQGVIVIATESGRIVRQIPMAEQDRPRKLQFNEDGSLLYALTLGVNSRVLGWNVVENELIYDQFFSDKTPGSVSSSEYVSQYALGLLAEFSFENDVLIHAFPGEFGASGNLMPGGTGVILRKLHY